MIGGKDKEMLAAVLGVIFADLVVSDTGRDPQVEIDEYLREDPVRRAWFVLQMTEMMRDQTMTPQEKTRHYLEETYSTNDVALDRLREIWRMSIKTEWRPE